MKTQKTITAKQINKGMQGIIKLTSTINQVLKQFQGIYTKVLPDTDDLTVEQWMAHHGVFRQVEKGGKKGHFTPATLMAGWHDGMKEYDDTGKTVFACIFKNVPAIYKVMEPGDPKSRDFRVFTKEEAYKADGKPISIYKLVVVDKCDWSIAKILKGLKQSANFTKENDKSVMSLSEWENLEEVYVVKEVTTKNDKGETVKIGKPIKIDKSLVTF